MLAHDQATRAVGRAPVCALLAALLLCLATAPGAGAASVEGGNAFNELSQKAQEAPAKTETSTTATTASKEEPHNDNKTLLIGIGAAVVLLLAIGYVIVRDARRAAPVSGEDPYDQRKGYDPAVRQRKRRAKAKAARAQRKRNR
ncbi:MAG TPA: hypothetical protein VGD00_11440 [Solirubrobacteraceae bacterium]